MNDDIILVTELGQALRYSERQVRPMGRTAAGVTAIRLDKDDAVIGMDVFSADMEEPKEIWQPWAKWAKEQGYKLSYVAEAEIIHVHNETPRGVYNRYRREAMALRKIYPEANFSIYDFFRLTITNIFSDLWHAARERVLWRNIASIFWFRFMQFHGTRMGHRETSLVTPQLRETFYYARERKRKAGKQRDVEPIRYKE